MMDNLGDGIEGRMAARLKARRIELGLSMGELAERSGVSKAMIAKIEAVATSPTAVLLGRLCHGLGITLSALMASVEDEATDVARAAQQPYWRDPDTGLRRTVVSPPSPLGSVEIARIHLPAGAQVEYPTPPAVSFVQHLLIEAGELHFTIGERGTRLVAGDCLVARIDRPTAFAAPDADTGYLVIVERHGSAG